MLCNGIFRLKNTREEELAAGMKEVETLEQIKQKFNLQQQHERQKITRTTPHYLFA